MSRSRRLVPPRRASHVLDLVLRRNSAYYWDATYAAEAADDEDERTHESIVKLAPLFASRRRVVDFGCGPAGNVTLLSEHLRDKEFHLVDHSAVALDLARKSLAGREGASGNRFVFHRELDEVPRPWDAVLCTEVLEHLTTYREVLAALWAGLADGGVLAVSVPVRGRKDRNREHVNKFTANDMIALLSPLSPWVSVLVRTWDHKREGALKTAYFCVEKRAEGVREPLVR